jgi:hypothetical protein
LISDYYVDRDTMRWAVSTRRSFNAIHQASMIKVDVFCAGDDPLTRGELDRRVFFDLEVGRIPVCSSEDIILQKLVWWREAGGSERQWATRSASCRFAGPHWIGRTSTPTPRRSGSRTW